LQKKKKKRVPEGAEKRVVGGGKFTEKGNLPSTGELAGGKVMSWKKQTGVTSLKKKCREGGRKWETKTTGGKRTSLARKKGEKTAKKKC